MKVIEFAGLVYKSDVRYIDYDTGLAIAECKGEDSPVKLADHIVYEIGAFEGMVVAKIKDGRRL